MGKLGVTKELHTSGVPAFQTVLDVAQGGFTLDTTGLTAGTTLAAGRAMIVNEATRIATPTTADANTPTGLLYEDVVVGPNTTVTVVTAGTVYNRRIPVLSAALKAKLPRITFSESF